MQRAPSRDGRGVRRQATFGLPGRLPTAIVCILCVAVLEGISLGDARVARGSAAAWSITTADIASQHPPTQGFLVGVSCASPTACAAVGTDGLAPIAARWDGTRWLPENVVNPAPDAPNGGELSGVSCVSIDNCIAVGEYQQNHRPFLELPLVEHWDGARWSRQITAMLPSDAAIGSLNAISCISREACIAVGGVQRSGGRVSALIERWDGTHWSIQTTPARGSSGWLEGVSCTSNRACTAVGDVGSGASGLFAERWDGTSWSVHILPGRETRDELRDVACSSTRACIAVGQFYDKADVSHPLVERWDGGRWSLQKIPGTASTSIELKGVSCVSSTACVAVGDASDSAGSSTDMKTLAERWDGTSWKREQTPNPPTLGNGSSLQAVSCNSSLICTAIGAADVYELAERRAIPLGFTVSRIQTFADGTIKLTMKVSKAGRVDVLETVWNDNFAHAAVLLRPAPGRFVFARKRIRTTVPGPVHVTIVPNHIGKLLVAHHRYRVVLRLWVSYTPLGRQSHSIGFYGLHLPAAR